MSRSTGSSYSKSNYSDGDSRSGEFLEIATGPNKEEKEVIQLFESLIGTKGISILNIVGTRLSFRPMANYFQEFVKTFFEI